MNVGESIKALRVSNGVTQVELGKVAGVSGFAVSQWENGRAVPRMGAIQKIADYFGVQKSTIMGDRPMHDSDLTEREEELIQCYRDMSPRFQYLLLENARAYRDNGMAKNNQLAQGVVNG